MYLYTHLHTVLNTHVYKYIQYCTCIYSYESSLVVWNCKLSYSYANSALVYALYCIAMVVMVALALARILSAGEPAGGRGHPPAVNVREAAALAGVCVYSFMCHHSLPSLLTPIADKRRLALLLSAVFGAVLTFYVLLSVTGSLFAQLTTL